MNLPDLTQIIDTYIPIVSTTYEGYYNQIQQELIPHIRKLQKEDLINWFSFLIHGPKLLHEIHGSELLNDKETIDSLYIHIRIQSKSNLSIHSNFETFITKLPEHFLNPIKVTLGPIDGLSPSFLQNTDWKHIWKLHGECSEFVLSLIENHKESVPIEQIVQFIHFITNPLKLGNRCTVPYENGFFRF